MVSGLSSIFRKWCGRLNRLVAHGVAPRPRDLGGRSSSAFVVRDFLVHRGSLSRLTEEIANGHSSG